ncbi:MAG: AAA family ATPase [Treponema sp.]|nr:AAA family ATPase [Treponema sp.]MCL2251053.1 AAA family ATPase [Treponema sp.]
MFLKRLSILGFKSFADRTEIEFNDGITALLGPNGCGKSNVVDAVKWVLGEHAIKSLRAEKMEDVIFGGTETRKALSVAEVTLSIANDSGLLPMDMPEVEIKRRLYRSGESEYFINQHQVRLKDIRELFWDTGVGKIAYSVMEQGKIDQILSNKPEERRYLFEEAAGITRFRERGIEAERNLAKTEENVHQMELILNEVKRSYDSLKTQSEKTMKYRTLRDEIFNFELDIQLLKLKQFRYDKDEKNETLRRRTADRDRIRAEMEAENKALEANMDEVNSMENRLVELQKSIYGLALEKNAKENEVRLFNEQRGENKLKIGQNEEREKQIAQKITELNNDAEGQDAVVADLRKQSESIEENIRSFEENIQLAATRISENEKDMRRAEEEIHGIEKELSVLEKDLAKITDDIVTELDAGLKKAGYSAAERKSTEEALRETLGKLRTTLSGREALVRDLSAAVSRSADVANSVWTEIGRIAENLAEGFAEAASGTDKAVELFNSYREHSATFIDEFLAPEGIITKKRALDVQIRRAKDGIEERRQKIKSLRDENVNLMAKIDEYRATLENLKVNRAHMKAQAQSAEEQAKLIRRELSGQEGLLKNIRDELSVYRKRLDEVDGRIVTAHKEIANISEKTTAFTKELENLEKDIRKRNDNVAGKKIVINKRMAELSKVQEALEKIHLELVQSEMEIKNIQENFRETHSRDLLEFEERIFTITAVPSDLREKLAGARTKMKELGSVNLMAPEEFAETKQRYEFLSNQMADLEKARKDLLDLTSEIRQESSKLFLDTYNRIKKNFHNMFRRLFGGGRAELRLSDPNHVLESGIEILAQPPGKKLEHLSLLSGGECSMTAVALLFATYMVKPSPFCLLDEIDAALDEQNVGRFVHLLQEFSDTSQFIIITHNKKTVTGAGTLLGVTMEESGVTKLIAVRLENEELAIEGEPPQSELWDTDGKFEEEDIQPEEGRELPIGVNDPKKVSPEQLRPIRAKKT